MKRFFFFFVLLFCVSVSAVLPTVDFDWYQSGNKNATTFAFVSTIFDSNIITDSNLSLVTWQFDTDGNFTLEKDKNIVVSDNFDDGDYTSNPTWWVTLGTWSAASNYLASSSGDANIFVGMDVNTIRADYNFSFKLFYVAGSHDIYIYLSSKENGGMIDNSYNLLFQDIPGTVIFRKIVNGVPTTLITGPTFEEDAWIELNLTVINGIWGLDINGQNYGTTSDSTFTDFNKFVFRNSAAVEGRLDDLNILSDQNIQVDFNVSHTFVEAGTKEICLTAQNSDGAATTCHDVIVAQNPDANITIEEFQLNAITGLNIADINAHFVLRCLTEITTEQDINYTFVFNGTMEYTALLDNNTTAYIPVSVLNGDNTGTFTCLFNSFNRDSNTSIFRIFTTIFTLVDEEIGTAWNTGDYAANFSDLVGKSYETGTTFDFISQATNTVSIASLVDDTFRLDINQTNEVQFFKEFTLSVLSADDNSINVCLATQQQIFEQVFVSSQATTGVILNHEITGCHALATYTNKAYQSNFAARAFTISDPYTLTFFDGNTKFVLSSLDGGSALEHNLQVLILNRVTYNIDIASDFLTISPVFNSITGENDSNKLKIAYLSLRNTNIALKLDVFLGSTIIWTHTETESPNDLAVIFDFTGLGLTDQNLLRLVAESTTAQETNTKTIYFTISTIGYGSVLPPIIAAAIAIILLLFGITLVTTRFGFGWFGILIALMSIAILSLAPGVWWILYLQGILLIILAFISFMYKNESSKVV